MIDHLLIRHYWKIYILLALICYTGAIETPFLFDDILKKKKIVIGIDTKYVVPKMVRVSHVLTINPIIKVPSSTKVG